MKGMLDTFAGGARGRCHGDAPPQGNNAIFDLALEKLLSDRGADFVSNVASGVARQAIPTNL